MCVSIGQHAVQSTEGQFSHAVGTLFGADHIAIVPSIHRIHSIVLSVPAAAASAIARYCVVDLAPKLRRHTGRRRATVGCGAVANPCLF